MNEKEESPGTSLSLCRGRSDLSEEQRKWQNRVRSCLSFAVCTVLGLWTVWNGLRLVSPHSYLPTSVNFTDPSRRFQSFKIQNVDLEAHIMSKCPDAKACIQKLVVPAMEILEDRVDFKLSFIGDLGDRDSDTVLCKHGPSECLGNMILLCAEHLYPEPRLSLGFANCMINDYPDIPNRDLVETCAMEHGLDFGKINTCISYGGEAQSLLRDSVERSSKAGIHTSCTIRLQKKAWCVTGEERDCDDGKNLDALVHDIEKQYEQLNP